MNPPTYLQHLAADIEATALVVESGDLATSVPWCPGWTIRDLVEHLGYIHRWARQAVLTAAPPSVDLAADPAGSTAKEIADWLRAGGARLIEALSTVRPGEPTWHPFPVAKEAQIWPRRQAHETMVHRWDAERASGRPATLDAAMAADGIDEYCGMILPRVVTRERLDLPSSVVGIHATDADRRWVVDGRTGTASSGGVDQAQAWIEGTAENVLLTIWGRPVADGAVAISGSTDVAAAWLSIGGA